MIEPISIDSEAIRNAIAHLGATIETRLRELGPGWAIGYRLKQQPYPATKPIGAPATIDMEWETHEVELIDGQVPLAVQGFQYVGLKP